MRMTPAMEMAVIVLLAVGSLAMPAMAAEDVQVKGSGSLLTGKVERITHRPGGRGGSTGTPAYVAPATPAPVVTRVKGGIVYDYTDGAGGEVHYVFDSSRDYCDRDTVVMTCYGPRPEPGETPDTPPAPSVTPEEIVERTLVDARLPQPQPQIDPGYAITGMTAYLETGNRTRHTFEPIATVLGPLRITATSTYTVDWGDGETTGPHDSTGGAYPDGTITHVYRDSEVVTVRVIQSWTAQWTLAGRSGTVGGLRSAGEIPDFAVREVQAVRTH